MIIALQALFLFRKSLINIFDRFLGPYFTNLLFNNTNDVLAEDDEDEVFAEFDDEKGVVFYPPVYAQRYAAVSDCLLDQRWYGKLEKVVDFGCNDMSFIKYLKDVPGVKEILGVDLEAIPLRCSLELKCDKYSPKRESPLKISLFQGNAADPDYRLIGCDAVVSIEMIEHMMCHDLDRFVHNVFGFIRPWVVVITTPNGDFNVLFKALETNGLRRLDHMFEWTREQFHDWCSNIVSRYPQYSVTCKGIGPGPSGTSHLGCCSQLALFFAKEYHKQPNLNINSLALVARASSTDNVSDMTDSWEYPESVDENNMLCGPNSVPSINKFLISENQSYITFVVDMVTSAECEDKILQCNLDTEFEKNFLFDNDLGHSIVIPRKKSRYREYEFESVVNRLNCTNVPVKKFSKVTHNLMAKNKMDTLVASRELVDEIRHLSKMLNFNKNMLDKHEGTWNNINWGENAPYWNQYYKIVREYSYPFETKSDENRILELISDEIYRLVDDEDWLGDKLEIPVEHLMGVVGHVTDDEGKVRELLEWNGYEVVGDVVVYCRLVDGSSARDDWLDVDAVSDWTSTDALSVSESVQEPVINDRGLRRALDQKIRNLRGLCKEEDITTELDRVVCRLMKLALNPRRGSEPPPSSWLLYKLYDLLTLTENAMMRRKKHFLEDSGICKMRAIDYEVKNNKFSARIGEDNLDKDNNLDRYQHLISNSDEDSIIEYFQEREELENLELSKKLNQNFDGNGNVIEERQEDFKNDNCNFMFNEENNDFEKEFLHNMPSNSSPTDSQKINTIDVNNRDENEIENIDLPNTEIVILNRSETKIKKNKNKLKGEKSCLKYRKSKIFKNITTKMPSYLNIIKYQELEYQNYVDVQNQQNYQNAMSSQPIPGSLKKVCQFGQREDKDIYKSEKSVCDYHKSKDNEKSRTEESMFMKIITMDGEETIAFHRTVGTDPENDSVSENDLNTEAIINVTKVESFTCYKESSVEKIESEIFLHDMNEPSTSDGIRHFSTDAQCGPDDTNHFISDIQIKENLSDIIPKPRKTGIKIEDSGINVQINKTHANIGTSTSGISVSNAISVATVTTDKKCQPQNKSRNNQLISDNLDPVFIEELVKPVCCALKSKESSEMWDSSGTLLNHFNNSSICGVQSPIIKAHDIANNSPVTRGRSQLSYGGIHVHCFKDRQVSEDIVYQGKWQRGNPKVVTKKNPIIYYKKNNDLIAKKKMASKQIDSCKVSTKNDVHINYKRPVTVRNTMLTNTTKKSKTKIQNHKYYIDTMKKNKKQAKSNELRKNIKPKTTISKTKVSSKITTSINRKKSSQTFISNRNPIKTSTPVKKQVENINIFNIKNYIPPYLKKRRNIYSKNENRNINPNFVNKFNNITSKTFAILNLNNDGDSKNYLPNENKINTSYFVYRNELDSEKNICKAEPDCTKNYVPASLPSTPESYSPCSSPNSVATVRDLSFQNKILLNTINSTCSERSSSDNIDRENDKNKNRKVFRKFKIYKKTNTSTGFCENKENIAVTIQNKIEEHFGKETNIVRNKDMLRTQIAPENTPFINLAVGRNKLQGSAKSTNIVSGNTEYCNELNLTVNKSFTRPNNQTLVSDKSFNKRTTCYKKLGSLDKAVKFTNGNESNATINSIEIDMKNLIEQNLNNIESASSNSKLIDMNFRNSDSVYSYKIEKEPSDATVVLSRDLKACNDDGESIPNRESEIHKISSTELDDVLLINVNPDLLSHKSIASITTSKFSEYFSADNEVDEDFFTQINDDSTVSHVHDTFDEKQNILYNEGTVTPAVDVNRPSDTECQLNNRVDFVNSVDSETGSHARLPGNSASGQQSLSDQSSDNTFESCTIDDDLQIPYWLFESDSEPDRPVVSTPLTVVGPGLDVNSNVMEPGVIGAGAGDGRGMHSDVSHESSEHGSSTSSSGTSSEMESQETLSDELQEPESSDQLQVVEIQDVAATLPDQPLNTSPATHGDSRDANSLPRRYHNLYPVIIVSDGDADISSMDTDAVNSDNN